MWGIVGTLGENFQYHMIMMNVILPLTTRNIQASYLMLFIVFYLLHMNIFETRARAIWRWTRPQRPGSGPVKLAEGWPRPTCGLLNGNCCNVRVLQKKKKSIKHTFTNNEYGSCHNIRVNAVLQKNKKASSIHIQTLYMAVATM